MILAKIALTRLVLPSPIRMNSLRLVKVVRVAGNRAILARNFHAGAPKESSSVLEADSSNQMTKWFHKSGMALAVLTPIAFVAPSVASLPIDLTLGVLFPFHSHVAMNYVITDYVPPAGRTAARGALLVATIVAAAGLLKLNIEGPGLTETVKSLWRAPKEEKK